eukprot:gene4023-2877_t
MCVLFASPAVADTALPSERAIQHNIVEHRKMCSQTYFKRLTNRNYALNNPNPALPLS